MAENEDDASPYAHYNHARRTPLPKVFFVKCGSCQQVSHVKNVSRMGEARHLLIEHDWLVIADESGTLDDLWLCPRCAPVVREELGRVADELDRRPPFREEDEDDDR